MSGLRGIAKNLSSLFSSHAISVLQNLALVPFFIHSYGAAGYGEWLALSSAVAYLGTLDFGVQTYVNQDLTVRYHSGDMDGFHVQQSTALRLLVGIVLAVAAIAVVSFHLPLQHWLRMDGSLAGTPRIPAQVVHWAVYLLALQTLINIPAGYFFGTFMVVGKAHIGGYWSNVKALLLLAVTIGLAELHVSFAAMALGQLCATTMAMAGAMVHLRLLAPEIFPTLRYWDGSSVGKTLQQSGYFAMIFSSNFLVYQVPVIILQRSWGGVAVTVFSLMRRIFSMTRMQMTVPTLAMGPEITTSYAQKDWKNLSRLYSYSERLIFAMIPVANVATLFLSPLLLVVWVRDRSMFDPRLYLLAAAISIVISVREHKHQFQFSTNTVREMGRAMVLGYLALGGIWLVLIPRYGIEGLQWGWLLTEFCLMLYIVRLNVRFFADYERLDLRLLFRVLALSAVFLGLSLPGVSYTMRLTLPRQVVAAVAISVVLALIDFQIFDLGPVVKKLRERWKQRASRRAGEEAGA